MNTPAPSRIESIPTSLAGLACLQRKPLRDQRGFLERMYCAEELVPLLGNQPIHAVNRTLTLRRGTVRGLHFQKAPHAEDKIVSCLRGAMFDVAVDLRRGSPTFLKWHSEILSAENCRSLLIPKGFAHGFQALSEDCELLYFHTRGHHPDSEGGLDALDPCLGIDWPLPIMERSDRDRSHPPLDVSFLGVTP